MGNMCPFIKNVSEENNSGDGTCISNLCKFWITDSTNEESGECLFVLQYSTNEQNKSLMKHIHDKHLHPKEHLGENQSYGDPYGMINYSNALSKSIILMSEFTSNMDLDGDGKIYGMDFSIKSDDDEPLILSSLKNNPNWPATIPLEINWKTYLESIV